MPRVGQGEPPRTQATHRLPVYFEQVITGNKPFEIRDNTDRSFQEGDFVTLNEFTGEHYTGRKVDQLITYVTDYAQQTGFVVFGMKETPACAGLVEEYLVSYLTNGHYHHIEIYMKTRWGPADVDEMVDYILNERTQRGWQTTGITITHVFHMGQYSDPASPPQYDKNKHFCLQNL